MRARDAFPRVVARRQRAAVAVRDRPEHVVQPRLPAESAVGGTASSAGQDERPDDALDPEQQLVQQDTVARVRRALEALPAEFREAIVLRDIEGLSYKEIAGVLGIPIGTVMSRISRGRERLLDTLKATASLEVVR